MRKHFLLWLGLPVIAPFFLLGVIVALVAVSVAAGWLFVVDTFN